MGVHVDVDVAVGGELRDPEARVHGPDGAADELGAASPRASAGQASRSTTSSARTRRWPLTITRHDSRAVPVDGAPAVVQNG